MPCPRSCPTNCPSVPGILFPCQNVDSKVGSAEVPRRRCGRLEALSSEIHEAVRVRFRKFGERGSVRLRAGRANDDGWDVERRVVAELDLELYVRLQGQSRVDSHEYAAQAHVFNDGGDTVAGRPRDDDRE